MRHITNIAVHCSATKPSQLIDANTIRGWHKKQGWADIGYHYVIKRDGIVENGRDLDGDGDILEEIGAHVGGFNANSIGICLIGGINDAGQADANFTWQQYKALKTLVDGLTTQFPQAKILGHRDFPNVSKACPSFNVKAFFGVK